MNDPPSILRAKRLGIDTLQAPVIYMHADCHVCRSEGFNALSRVQVTNGERSIIGTLNIVFDGLVAKNEVGCSEAAWRLLQPLADAQPLVLSHPRAINSLSYVRGKIYGNRLSQEEMGEIVTDIAANRYTDVQLAAFVTSCVGDQLNVDEITYLTQSMIAVGERLQWGKPLVVDKHCVGGLPGNRTTPIVVAIVCAHDLIMPKTSSRAITSPAGTADTMETLAPVELSLATMRSVVEKENGCIVWGGAVNLSPADDILIRVERALDLDSEGQLVASVLSKKISAGSTHVLVDLPVGPTAKIRHVSMAEHLGDRLKEVGHRLGIHVLTHISDGSQPVGLGIGPALEAHDILAVLQNKTGAPDDLIDRSCALAGQLLEMAGKVMPGEGYRLAEYTLSSGAAWRKFQAICEAQGGMREPGVAAYQYELKATRSGVITHINNRLIARIAKLAGAPASKTAGIKLAHKLGAKVAAGDLLFLLHAETPGELEYALEFYSNHPETIIVEDEII